MGFCFWLLQLIFFQQLFGLSCAGLWSYGESYNYVSAVGDPGMKNPNVRVGLEAWNFCNEVGFEAPKMGSPRLADCADLYCPSNTGTFSIALFFSMKFIQMSLKWGVFFLIVSYVSP